MKKTVKKREDKSAAIVAKAKKGAMVNAGFFNRLFFLKKKGVGYKMHGAPLSTRTYVKFDCERDGAKYRFTAKVEGQRIGGVCQSVNDIGRLIGGGPDPTIKK